MTLVRQFRTVLSPKKANTEVPGSLSEQDFGASALEPQHGVSGSERAGWVSELMMGLREYKALTVSNKIHFIDLKGASHI